MSKFTYFPLIIDRWVSGTRQLTYEQKGFYMDMIVWLFETGEPIKNADHAAKILGCDPRTSRRLLADLRPKFRLTSAGLRHKLVDKLLRNGCKLRGLEAINFPLDPDPDPEEDKRREDPPSVSFPHAKSQPQNCRFAEWWEAYPKKTGKKPCSAIWKRRGLDSMADALIADVKTRALQDAGWLDGYVPNPQTYLNQDRWEDEINTERAKASNGRKTYDDYMQNLGAGVDAGPPGEILGGNVVAVRPKVVR